MSVTSGADIQLSQVVKIFKTGVSPTSVLKGVDLQIAAGDTIAITGASGSGKTTLLQLIGALDTADSGDVRVNGRELATLNEVARAQFRNREVGFVFQTHILLPQLTALENVLVPTWASPQVHAPEHRARANYLLERVGLADRKTHLPGQLSGGECQRVAVARALIMKPSLLLADEPTGSLDYDTAQRLLDLLLALNAEEGATFLLVTHARDCARRMARQVELRNGVINCQ